MQLLGFEVKLFRTKGKGANKRQEEVDLSKRFVRPCKEVKKEIKRLQKGKGGKSDDEDEENLNGTSAAASLQGPREGR